MQNLFPILPYVCFVKYRQATRLFPVNYIAALAQFLDGRSATVRLVRTFNDTAKAQSPYDEAQADFEAAISERGEHTPTQVADILCITKSAVSNWIKVKALPFKLMETQRRNGKLVPFEPGQRALLGKPLIQAKTLRTLFTWSAPF